MKFHIHLPELREQHGVNTYHTCRCGAQRVVRRGGGYSPVIPGWKEHWS